MDIAALLIKYNTCVNATDKWAFTPLHEAAQKGRTQLCALLLAHGADPTMKNQEGQTPLDLATVSPHCTCGSCSGGCQTRHCLPGLNWQFVFRVGILPGSLSQSPMFPQFPLYFWDISCEISPVSSLCPLPNFQLPSTATTQCWTPLAKSKCPFLCLVVLKKITNRLVLGEKLNVYNAFVFSFAIIFRPTISELC